MIYNVELIGNGMTVPKRKVFSHEITKENELKKGVNPYGVRTRYWAVEESNSSLGAEALSLALLDAKIEYEELDLIIYASATYDYPLPTTACMIPKHLNKEHLETPCMDINASCLSFLSALEVAASLILSSTYKTIAIVSSEIASKSLDPNSPEVYGLFGDGAASFILRKSNNSNSKLSHFKFKTYPKGALLTYVPAGGNIQHRIEENPAEKWFTFQMEGRRVLKFTLDKFKIFMKDYEKLIGKQINSFSCVVPHQASRLSLEFFIKSNKLKENQVQLILEDYGNCVAASIPMALALAIQSGKIKRGDEVLLVGSAAGITLGAVSLVF
jgi:3-oxoacyl-[acyl-carrier-protein] synthase III